MKVKFNSFRESIVAALKKKPKTSRAEWEAWAKERNSNLKFKRGRLVGVFKK